METVNIKKDDLVVVEYQVFESLDGVHVFRSGEGHLPDKICWCCPVVDSVSEYGVAVWVHREMN